MNTITRDKMIAAAKKAAGQAYAPYSKYRVGAAVLAASGEIYCGCNVENASYGLTICAERVALFGARCAGETRWTALVIYAPSPPAPLPCGACRQVMAEGGNSPHVIVVSHDDTIREFEFNEILPHSFDMTM